VGLEPRNSACLEFELVTVGGIDGHGESDRRAVIVIAGTPDRQLAVVVEDSKRPAKPRKACHDPATGTGKTCHAKGEPSMADVVEYLPWSVA
jgi:hypothetical protein